jgi:uncharacterized membrane protein YidH (DUF202 family)
MVELLICRAKEMLMPSCLEVMEQQGAAAIRRREAVPQSAVVVSIKLVLLVVVTIWRLVFLCHCRSAECAS